MQTYEYFNLILQEVYGLKSWFLQNYIYEIRKHMPACLLYLFQDLGSNWQDLNHNIWHFILKLLLLLSITPDAMTTQHTTRINNTNFVIGRRETMKFTGIKRIMHQVPKYSICKYQRNVIQDSTLSKLKYYIILTIN